VPVSVSADEEISGPFLLARGIFAGAALRESAAGAELESLDRTRELLAGRDDPTMADLPPDLRVLRVYDQVTMVLRAVATQRPFALLLDDLQWADDDSLRALRYLARTEPTAPIFLMLVIRPEESAVVGELTKLLADLERLGIIRRIRLSRFRQPDTAALLQQTLVGNVDTETASAIQRQAEGVPFIIAELARTYRETGLLQQIDGSWRLARKAGTLMPSAVRTLIHRRAARLPEETKQSLAEAAVLGRTFRVADVCAIRSKLGTVCDAASLAETFAPAAGAGLLTECPPGTGADYRFSHEQVREFAAGTLPLARRRAVNAAIVEIMTADGDPPAESLPTLARHALDAGDATLSTRFSIGAARAALAANAPEEAIRLVDAALGAATTPNDRVALLRARDDGLAAVRRPEERLESIAELSALAEAAGDVTLEMDVMLRRAAALRAAEQQERAAELARGVRARASAVGDRPAELAACLELGQDLMRATIGEGFTATPVESDLDGAEEAYARAAALAEELGDKRTLAHATRELGVVAVSRVRAWFVERIKANEHLEILEAVASGAPLLDLVRSVAIYPVAAVAEQRLQRALELFTELADRRGAMSTLIAMAYLSWGPDIHIGSNPVQRIEEVRRLTTSMSALAVESDRVALEAQMLYGVHVFARAKLVPDLALTRGEQAFQTARTTGDRRVEFLAAGGVALEHLELGDAEAADTWLDRAAAAATAAPTPHRAWQLEEWRALAAATRGDLAGMRDHFDRAVRLAADSGYPAAHAQTLAALATEAARLGSAASDAGLLGDAEVAAKNAVRLSEGLPGHPLWRAQAESALALVELARGHLDVALSLAQGALAARNRAMREDPHLEVLLPAGKVLDQLGSDEERSAVRRELRWSLAMVAQRVQDEQVRVRWFRGPLGRAIAEIAGAEEPATVTGGPTPAGAGLDPQQLRILQAMTEGRTDHEIATELTLTDAELGAELTSLYARIGASSVAEATAFAFREQVV
jgi:tetratricopeptide (TPR) repeat protein